MKPREDRLTRVILKRETGQRLAVFLEDEAITAFFDGLETNLIGSMLGAALEDDKTRLNAATAVGALRALRSYLAVAARDGERAEDAYRKMMEEDRHGQEPAA